MECKETGEFAHRETTQYEQMETFNEEVGVHLLVCGQPFFRDITLMT